jgi:glyoxylate reductase
MKLTIARGQVVDEQALVDALKSGRGEGILSPAYEPQWLKLIVVMRAALDVFEKEPQVHPELLTNPNVVSRHEAAPGHG